MKTTFSHRSGIKSVSMILMFAMIFTAMFGALGAAPALAAENYYISSLPVAIQSYPVSTGNNTPAYNSTSGGAKSGTIYASDLCTVNNIYGDWLRVTYPTGGGKTRTLYARTSSFFCGTSYRKAAITKYAKAYRRSSGTAAIGSVDANDKLVYIIGNASGGRYQTVYKVTGTNYYKAGWVETGAVRFATTYYDPTGCFDSVSSGSNNSVSVSGWAYDGDNTGKQIDVHVYVGGPAGSSSAYGVNLGAANAYRPDVHKAYKCGNYHGFSKTFSVPASYGGTTQTVYVYAINIGGGSNKLIGTKSVYIKGTSSGTSWQWPMNNATCSWRSYGSNWSWNEHKTGGSGGRNYHLGLDLKGSDSNVYAAAAGKVVACSSSNSGANGRFIVIEHNVGGKKVYSFYAHLSALYVSNNTNVAKGARIASFGGSGYGKNNYYGSHLHFAIVDKLWTSGGYWGYAYSSNFTGNKAVYDGVTYYNPKYVVTNNRLP